MGSAAVLEPLPSRGEVAIEIRDLAVRYGCRCAVSDVTLSIPRRAVTAVVGPSGCGKTTLLRTLNRLHDLSPNAAVEGEVLLEGEAILGPAVDVGRLRRRVGMIFQRPNPFPLSIERNITLALEEHGVHEPGALRAMVEGSLRAVGLWDEVRDQLHSSGQSLSGGQQQRLCLARAIALRPDVLLLDEPCSSLDPLCTATIEHLIRTLRGDLTIVLVTHNLAQARRVSDYTAVMWRENGHGTIIERGATRAVFGTPCRQESRDYLAGRIG
jgi:phosphate transport system ATP-binding protein